MRRILVLVPLAAALLAIPTAAQERPVGPFRPVDPVDLPLDRSGVWTLNFAYIPPRITTVETSTGPRTVWYMVYRVWNTSDTPVLFVPEFELVTKDGELRTFLDEPQPTVVKRIRELEDPTGAYGLKTSVQLSEHRIPVTKPDSVPRAVHGVAVWLDVPAKAGTTNNFSIYITGLSNGLAVSESDAGGEVISRKTLQIDFHRPTDEVRQKLNDIHPNENTGLGAEKWIYRVIPSTRKAVKAEPKKDEGK